MRWLRVFAALSVLALVGATAIGCIDPITEFHDPGVGSMPGALAPFESCNDATARLRDALTVFINSSQIRHPEQKPTTRSWPSVAKPPPDDTGLVRSDGRRIVGTSLGKLWVIDASARRVTGSLPLDGEFTPTGLILFGDRVLVVGQQAFPMPSPNGFGNGMAAVGFEGRVILVDLTAVPTVAASLRISGHIIGTRLRGTTASILVESSPFVFVPEDTYERRDSAKVVRKAIARTPIERLVPQYLSTVNGVSTWGHLDCTSVVRPRSYTATLMYSLWTMDVASGSLQPTAARAMLSNGSEYYLSSDHAYVSHGALGGAAPTSWYRYDTANSGAIRPSLVAPPPAVVIDQTANGDIRTADSNGLTVLRPDGDQFRVVTKIDVRWPGGVGCLGRLCYLFGKEEPRLIHIADPQAQRSGALPAPGGQVLKLCPVGPNAWVAVAMPDGSTSRTYSLIDLRDVGRPALIDQVEIKRTESAVSRDLDTVSCLPEGGLVVDRAEVFRVLDNRLEHSGAVVAPRDPYTPEPWPSRAEAQRSLLLGNMLWTMFDFGLVATDMTTFKALGIITFHYN